ncbi:ACHB-like protein [Mya arenaria]|uniref:ACHB-like protein n=1 Tax=Mya arenaria TaxID=6604 RepID=A0ABY7DEJ6_MYAAR|nr:acetylcholine receptor subunit beta-like [Mya arenaria]WAQ95162.1 ACHB-like protein [Mya arenaria]
MLGSTMHRMICTLTTCLILATFSTSTIDGQTWNGTRDLLGRLMDGYDRRIRPVRNQSHSVHIRVNFELYTFKEIDEISGTFSVAGNLELIWRDENLSWDPSKHEGVYSLVVPLTEIWYPALLLANPDASDVTIQDDDRMDVRIVFDGSVYLYPTGIIASFCDIRLLYYPFDKQTCGLIFYVRGFSSDEIVLEDGESYLSSNYSGNGAWNLINKTKSVDVLSNASTYFATFTYEIERKWLFAMVNMLFPLVFLSVLNLLVFVLPPDSGERVSFTVTILLAIAVFLTLVGDSLPKVSEPFPVFCYYLLAMLSLSTAMTIVTIVNLRIFHKDPSKKPPALTACLVNVLMCYSCTPKRKKEIYRTTLSQTNETQMNGSTHQSIQSDHVARKTVTWKDVSHAVDIMSILIFVLACLFLNVYFLLFLQAQ